MTEPTFDYEREAIKAGWIFEEIGGWSGLHGRGRDKITAPIRNLWHLLNTDERNRFFNFGPNYGIVVNNIARRIVVDGIVVRAVHETDLLKEFRNEYTYKGIRGVIAKVVSGIHTVGVYIPETSFNGKILRDGEIVTSQIDFSDLTPCAKKEIKDRDLYLVKYQSAQSRDSVWIVSHTDECPIIEESYGPVWVVFADGAPCTKILEDMEELLHEPRDEDSEPCPRVLQLRPCDKVDAVWMQVANYSDAYDIADSWAGIIAADEEELAKLFTDT